MAYTQMTLIMFLNKLQEEKEKRVPFKKPTNLLIQIETFGWLHAWSEPRISIFYDSHIDESWSDVIL